MQCTNLRRMALVVAAGFLFVSNVAAQNEPVHNWAAPLYWQPSAREAALMKQAGEVQRGSQEQPQLATGPAGATAPLVFVGITPCRMMDTRGYDPTFVSGTVYGPPAMPAGYRVLPVAGVTAGYCTLPSSAQAVSLNVTLSPNAGSPVEYIELWPDLGTFPTVSTMNDLQGQMVNNAAVVALGSDGAFDVLVTNPTNLFIDMNGYYVVATFTAPSAVALEAGTASAPSLTFSDSGTSGLYSPSPGTIDITAMGSNILAVNSSGVSVTGNATVSGSVNLSGSLAWQGTTVLQFPGGLSAANLSLGPNAMSFVTHSFGGNTALGYSALYENQSGMDNTAVGGATLSNNNAGASNTAVGYSGLFFNQGGSNNTAAGAYALGNNTSGGSNTASGSNALPFNNVGSNNTAAGAYALYNNISGSGNIAVGYSAASSVSGGSSNNIHIGTLGSAFDNGIIRIGGNTALGDPAGQTEFFASGIYGTTTGATNAIPVVVDSNGQLGTTSSSRRFKTDIADMGDTTDTLMSLRPVQFRYIAHGPGSPLQYGLIAEEVAEVAPELVVHNANGEIETVFYDKVNAILLNQVQAQQRQIESQKAQIESQQTHFQSQLQAQREQFTGLISQLESRLAELESRAK